MNSLRLNVLLMILLACSLFSPLLATAEDWHEFRGPTRDGHAKADALPLRWTESENIAWKTAIHDRGWSSPVVAGGTVWLTTATEDGHKLFAVCIDAASGVILHDLHVFDVKNPMKITSDNTYATPTPVIVGDRVVVHYGTYGTACLDAKSGRKLWVRRDLNCDHEVGAGPASSPSLINGQVVVHVDGRDMQYIVALDPESGKTAWKTTRSIDFSDIPVHHRKAYCMPMVAPRGSGQQIISPAGRALYSYDLNGRELWRVRHRGWSVAPRPVHGHGLVFAIIDRDQPELWAIRGDGDGDVTDSHIVWRETQGMPARCSPMLVGDLLFLVSRKGIVTCLEAKTGSPVWKQRLSGQYSASPLFASGRIYLFNEDATTTVFRAARKWEPLATNKLQEQPLFATPAVVGNALIVRTASHLYRIEKR